MSKESKPDFSFEGQMRSLRRATIVAFLVFCVIAGITFTSMHFMTPEDKEKFVEIITIEPEKDTGQDIPGYYPPSTPDEPGMIPDRSPQHYEFDNPEEM